MVIGFEESFDPGFLSRRQLLFESFFQDGVGDVEILFAVVFGQIPHEPPAEVAVTPFFSDLLTVGEEAFIKELFAPVVVVGCRLRSGISESGTVLIKPVLETLGGVDMSPGKNVIGNAGGLPETVERIVIGTDDAVFHPDLKVFEKDLFDTHGESGVDVHIVGALEHHGRPHLAPCLVLAVNFFVVHHGRNKTDDDTGFDPGFFRGETVDGVGVKSDHHVGIGLPCQTEHFVGKVDVTVGQVCVPLLPGFGRSIEGTAAFTFAVSAPVVFADIDVRTAHFGIFPVVNDLFDESFAGNAHLDVGGISPGSAFAVVESEIFRMALAVLRPPAGESVSVAELYIAAHAHLFEPAVGVDVTGRVIGFHLVLIEFGHLRASFLASGAEPAVVPAQRTLAQFAGLP